MFLNEVILGKEHHISKDDPRLVKPPSGYDSVVARGQVEPGKFLLIAKRIIEASTHFFVQNLSKMVLLFCFV